MTPKTETLYRPLDEYCDDTVLSDVLKTYCEPFQVHVAGDLYRKVESDGCPTDFEKVNHIFPMTEGMSPKQISGTSSDDYEYVLLKECDEIREGDEWFGFEGWEKLARGWIGKKAEDLPHRRRVSKSDNHKQIAIELNDECCRHRMKIDALQKTVEELEKAGGEHIRLYNQKIKELRETIESQKREIISQSNKIHDQITEINRLEGELESETKWAKEYHDQLELKTEACLEWERKFKEAKKGGIVWKECEGFDNGLIVGSDHKSATICIGNNQTNTHIKTTFNLPQPRTVEDEANEVWNDSNIRKAFFNDDLNNLDELKRLWIRDFKAAKEPKGEE